MLLRWAVLLVQLTTLDATKLTSWGKKNCMAAGTFHVICGHSFTRTKERCAPRGEQYLCGAVGTLAPFGGRLLLLLPAHDDRIRREPRIELVVPYPSVG
ncbi:hypothetical protein V8E53_004746 [Lactarius tabidus]